MSALLVKSQLRFVVRHPVDFVASLAGVALAITAVVAVHLVSQSIRDAIGTVAAPDTLPGGHTHVVTRTALTEADYFDLRQRWRRGEFAGVEALLPIVDGYVRAGRERLRLVGLDPLAGGGGGGMHTSLRVGDRGDGAARFLTGDVLIAAPAAAQAIEAAGGEVAGIPVNLIESPSVAVMLADLPTAQRLLGREGQLDAVWIRVASPRSRLLDWLDRLFPGIAAALPGYAAPSIKGFQVVAKSRWNPVRRFADSIAFNLGALALLSLLMAAFLAAQASVSHAARQRRERERLLAIGVARGRLRLLAAGEGFCIGCTGAVLGLGLGIGIADMLLQTMGSAAARAPVDGWVAAKALVGGVAVSSIGPLLAARRNAGRHRWFRHGAGLLAAAVAALGLVDGSLLAVFAALLAICLVQISHIVPFFAALAGKLTALTSTRLLSTRSNLRAVAQQSGEIRLAVGALSVAAAVAVGMNLMVASLGRDFTDMLDQRLWAGVYLGDPAGTETEYDIDWIRGLPGVRDVRRYGDFDARLADGPVQVSLAQLDAAETARYEFAGPLPHGGMLNEVGARLLGLEVGTAVTVVGAGASVEVKIAHVFRDFGAVAPRLILPVEFGSRFEDGSIRWQRLAVLADPNAVAALTATLGERYGAARVRNQSDIRALAMAVFDRTFVVSRSLTAVALAVAAAGLYAALTALQASREHVFRLLSAVGCSRAEIWRLALAQTTILGAIATLAALPLGIVIAWTLCDFVNPQAFGWSIDLRLDGDSLAHPLLVGAAAAILAGAIPAYRSSFRASSGE